MDEIVQALADQHAELAGLLDDLDPEGWAAPSRCEGWSVADVVLHLAQTDEMAIASLDGTYDDVLAAFTTGLEGAGDIDELAGLAVERERGLAPGEVHERWQAGVTGLAAQLVDGDLSRRVPWVAGTLSARTLAVTRMTECWVHSCDVAHGLGVDLEPTARLRHVARLSWRTLPYAFTRDGREPAGPVAFDLTGPNGHRWVFAPDEPAITTISGDAVELCEVATRRLDASETSLVGDGPDADAVLALVRSYA